MIGVMSNEEVEATLRRHRVGRIGCSANDRPYVVPITYAYDGEDIYAYSANGRKVSTMREQPLVCFEIDEIEGPSSWRSVLVEGRYDELTEPEGRTRALRLLNGNGGEPVLRTPSDAAGDGVVLFRIDVLGRSGRFERRDA